MKKVDHQAEREQLIEAAITAGAEVGPCAVTAQMIDAYSESGRAYIYRYFIDKEDLIKKAFLSSDRNFFDNVESRMHFLIDSEGSFQERTRLFYDSLWEYSVADLKYCKFYVSFYFSEMFDAQIQKEHEKNGRKAKEMLGLLLGLENERDEILHHMWLMALTYIMEIAIGFATEEEYKERVYRLMVDCLKFYSNIKE